MKYKCRSLSGFPKSLLKYFDQPCRLLAITCKTSLLCTNSWLAWFDAGKAYYLVFVGKMLHQLPKSINTLNAYWHTGYLGEKGEEAEKHLYFPRNLPNCYQTLAYKNSRGCSLPSCQPPPPFYVFVLLGNYELTGNWPR